MKRLLALLRRLGVEYSSAPIERMPSGAALTEIAGRRWVIWP